MSPRRFQPSSPLIPLLCSVAACQPELLSDPAETDRPPPSIVLEPDAPLDAAPRVVRLHVHGLPEPAVESELRDRLVLARGQLGSAHLGQLARGDISHALAERLVPTLAWRADDGHAVLVPTEPLEAGETYSLGCGDPKFAYEMVVQLTDPVAYLPRLWPPAGEAAHAAVAVWCGEAPLRPHLERVVLAPSGASGLLRTGALDDAQGAQCLRFEADQAGGTPTAQVLGVPPPLWPLSPRPVRLDPRPLERDGEAQPGDVAICESGEITFGPGCAAIHDDRALVRTPARSLLWSVAGAGLDRVMATQADQPFWLHPLPVERVIELSVRVGDTAGESTATTVITATRPAMAHVVVNEVLANPIGAEPEQEWVEIYNDGLAVAQLEGYELVDAGGHTALPSATLAPGQFALLVNEEYDRDDEFDPPPPEDALLLRVASLGKWGLSNQGEPLALRDAGGHTVSRFPAEPKPKSGESVLRVAPMAPDGSESSFVRSDGPPTPGRPNELPENKAAGNEP